MKNMPLFSGSAGAWQIEPMVGCPLRLPQGVRGRGLGQETLSRSGQVPSSGEGPQAVSVPSPCAVLDLEVSFSLQLPSRLCVLEDAFSKEDVRMPLTQTKASLRL